jgi:hypothetical protein
MVWQKLPLLWAQKSIYILLVVWVGGLAPLIFVENFSVHRGVQRVRFSLLQESDSARLPGAVRQLVALQGEQRPAGDLNSRTQLVARPLALPEITSALKVFHDNFWLYRMFLIGFIGAVLWGSVFNIQLTACSVDLPPPEKPPSFPPELLR